jgi:ATP-dependent protease ClpP protease subunit
MTKIAKFVRLVIFMAVTLALVAGAALCRTAVAIESPDAGIADAAPVSAPVVETPRSIPMVADICAPGQSPCIAKFAIANEITKYDGTHIVFMMQLAQFAKADAILFLIHSPGGSMKEAAEVVAAIKTSKVPVYCIADGLVASAAFWIYQNCKERMITKDTIMVTHEASAVTDEPMRWVDLEREVVGLKAANIVMALDIAPRMQMTQAAYLSKVHEGDWKMNVAEAVAAHAADTALDDVHAAVVRTLRLITPTPAHATR